MRPRRAAAQVTSTGAVGSLYGTLSGLGARTLEDPRDLSRVAAHLKRDPVIRAQTAGEQLEVLQCRLHPPDRSQLPGLHDRDLAELAMDIQPDRSHPNTSTSSSQNQENKWANDTDGFALEAQPDKSQGRPLKSTDSKPIGGCPVARRTL